MSAKHRRTPSAMPANGFFAFDEDPGIPFPSTLNFSPPAIHTFEVCDKEYFKLPSKTTTNTDLKFPQNFSYNSSTSSNNDLCSFKSDSSENILQNIDQLHEFNEENETSHDESKENPIIELKIVIKEIIKTRKMLMDRLDTIRKDIKEQLGHIFSSIV
ncbi:hypothetical protein SteCoe_4290 [Stentor coeruleus]|uniref:Uncharacterized protein n=1 Tax=Stentor coeruleus TaxID=5963 RepID=A0A1R2CV10_9CILI|nr:hypothetical protein SteCoe_4290 [Stentor coeruleus]